VIDRAPPGASTRSPAERGPRCQHFLPKVELLDAALTVVVDLVRGVEVEGGIGSG
jgi:hypothetical protein